MLCLNAFKLNVFKIVDIWRLVILQESKLECNYYGSGLPSPPNSKWDNHQ